MPIVVLATHKDDFYTHKELSGDIVKLSFL